MKMRMKILTQEIILVPRAALRGLLFICFNKATDVTNSKRITLDQHSHSPFIRVMDVMI